MVSDFGFRISGFGFQVSGFGFRVAVFRVRFSGFRLGFRVQGIHRTVPSGGHGDVVDDVVVS